MSKTKHSEPVKVKRVKRPRVKTVKQAVAKESYVVGDIVDVPGNHLGENQGFEVTCVTVTGSVHLVGRGTGRVMTVTADLVKPF